MNKTAIIENWSFVTAPTDPWMPPEFGTPRFHGNVYNYPGRKEGEAVYTSELQGYNPETDEFICLSRNYKLGKVNEEYEKAFPNAKERLILALQKKECPKKPNVIFNCFDKKVVEIKE